MQASSYHEKPLHSLRFLVTGGAGFIGSHLVGYLLAQGAKQVRVMDNLLTGSRANLAAVWQHPAFEFLEGDIRDPEACLQACEGIDIISHQAALGSIPRSIRHPATTHAINASGFVNVLVAARDRGVQRVVFASSSSVYGDDPHLPKREEHIGRQISPYAVSKYTNELYAHVFGELYDLTMIGLRYFNVFGPRQDPNGPYAAVIPLFISQMMNDQRPIIHGDGSQTRDFTFVENVVQANVLAMMTEAEAAYGEIFNIALGAQTSVLALFQTIKKLLNNELEAEFRPRRRGDILHSQADISKAKRILGYKPYWDLEAGLKETIKALR